MKTLLRCLKTWDNISNFAGDISSSEGEVSLVSDVPQNSDGTSNLSSELHPTQRFVQGVPNLVPWWVQEKHLGHPCWRKIASHGDGTHRQNISQVW
jgi:hypothetical protein